MSTKLIAKNQKIYKWKFEEDINDPDACIFHIKIRSNRNRIESQLLKEQKLLKNAVDFGNEWYGDNIVKIENADGEMLEDRAKIIDFCLDRLSENQGTHLQLAIQNFDDYLDKGIIKN